MKKLAIFIAALLIFSAGAFAQDLPRIAVYVTGNVGEDEKKALGTRMLASLINSKRYKGIERSNSFLAEIEKEQEKQMSGDIDDNQISALGKQFGVKFVCIADITPAYGSFQVSARIVNVETAEVDFIGEAFSPLQTSDDLVLVSDNVVENMFSGKTSSARKQTVQTEQAAVTQPQRDALEGRKHDWYYAGRYVLPIGGMPWVNRDIWFPTLSLESGLVWGKGTFLGFDLGLGVNWDDWEKRIGEKHVTLKNVLTGGVGINLGSVYDLPVGNLQLAYGGAVGFWGVLDEYTIADSIYNGWDDYGGYSDYSEYFEDKRIYNFFAPFVKLRWKYLELSYRGLYGYYQHGIYDRAVDDYDDDVVGLTHYKDGLGWNNHQVMLGVYFETSKRERSQQTPPERTERKRDWYIASKYILPVGGMPLVDSDEWFPALCLEGGLIWKNGMFLGIDLELGFYWDDESERIGEKHVTLKSGEMWGGGINFGKVYDLPVQNLQLVYGGAVGIWWVYDNYMVVDSIYRASGSVTHSQREYYSEYKVNLLAPFVKLRWKYLELSYRGLLGPYEKRYDKNVNDDSKDDSGLFGWNNHQVMLGLYFATSKKVRQ